ncbi:MAG: hypothetical protein ABGX40_08475 [Methylococcales bacterium]
MRLNKEEIEAFVQDQTADDAIEVQEISDFHEEQDHLNYLSDVNLFPLANPMSKKTSIQ